MSASDDVCLEHVVRDNVRVLINAFNKQATYTDDMANITLGINRLLFGLTVYLSLYERDPQMRCLELSCRDTSQSQGFPNT